MGSGRRCIRQCTLLAAVILGSSWLAGTQPAPASPINPQVFKARFDQARKDAKVVAHVRVLAVSCTSVRSEEGKPRAVMLQIALQISKAEKGPIRAGDVLVVRHEVALPEGPGPRMYGYMAAQRQFPFTPGVKGDVALRWDREKRAYRPVAGWVADPNGAAIPTEVGKAYVAGDEPPAQK
ncbi:MAG TPA: hypothetical protein VFA18_23325 [Gemmataceae bacterium]|nr:hypothetical protein [Gemmataceae bacterium]